jgi:putative DNA primase/helicase
MSNEASPKIAQPTRKPFNEEVADRLVEQIKTGTAPWQKPWEPGQEALPHNASTGHRYKGFNAVWLMAQGRTDSRWFTYKQAQDMGAQVRAGEQGTTIQYWKFDDTKAKKDEAGKIIKDAEGNTIYETYRLQKPRAFYATVFNAEQIEGLPPRVKKAHEWDPLKRAEAILEATGARIMHRVGDEAYYSPQKDIIVIPERYQFKDRSAYYATALHEAGHWTGHASRLNRDLSHPFGSDGYAKEELRAEIASMILGAEIGTGHDPSRHVAYVGAWIKAIRDDPNVLQHAASDAEKIVTLIKDLERRRSQRIELGETQKAAMKASLITAKKGLAHSEEREMTL